MKKGTRGHIELRFGARKYQSAMFTLAGTCLACFCSLTLLQAQVIVTYPDLNPTGVAEGVTATPLNTTGSSLPDLEIYEGLIETEPVADSTSAALAVDYDQFFQFTLTPGANRKLDLGVVTFEADYEDAGSPRGWVLRSSIDGFSTDLASEEVWTEHPVLSFFSIRLPEDQFLGLTEPVTFRIYTYASGGGDRILDFDNIQVLGTVDMPPRILLRGPTKVRTSKPRYRVRGFAYDDDRVARVLANGKVLRGKDYWTTTVRVRARTTKVRFYAIDSAGLVSRQVLFRVIRAPRAGRNKPINFL